VLTAGPQRSVAVTWRLSSLARRLATLALAGLFLAVITRRPEFAGLAAPALLLLVPRPSSRPASVGVTLAAVADQVTESEQATLLARITGYDAGTLRLRLHPAAWITAGPAACGADGWHRLPFRVRHWGQRPIGTLEVVLHDRWRLAEGRATLGLPAVTCLPRPARLESLVVLSKLPARLGEHAARATGEGTEFAGVREFVPGDRQRRINWPATTRRGTLQLNTFAAERAQVTVILLDVSTDVGAAGESTADLAVRAAAGAAAAYLAARDRVGLISFGRQVRWISPAPGRRQADRIMHMITFDSGDGEPLTSVSRLPNAALPPGALIIDFSSIRPDVTVELAGQAAHRGFRLIDAPVSGGEAGAVNASLSIMVGGSAEDFAAAEPLLQVVGKTIVHVGPNGSGQTVKAANQLIVAGNIQLLAEAVVFLEAYGVDTAAALEVLGGGLAGSKVLDQKGQKMLDRSFDPGFRIELHHKDLGIVTTAAREAGVVIPVGAILAQLMASAKAVGDGGLDHSALLRGVERLSGR